MRRQDECASVFATTRGYGLLALSPDLFFYLTRRALYEEPVAGTLVFVFATSTPHKCAGTLWGSGIEYQYFPKISGKKEKLVELSTEYQEGSFGNVP